MTNQPRQPQQQVQPGLAQEPTQVVQQPQAGVEPAAVVTTPSGDQVVLQGEVVEEVAPVDDYPEVESVQRSPEDTAAAENRG